MIVRKFLLVFSVFYSALFLAAPSGICEELKIGFVSTDRVFKESAPAIRSQQALQKEFAGKEAIIKDTADSAKALQAKLDKEALTMNDATRQAAEVELGKLSRELQRLQREFREELNLRKNEEMKIVLEMANKAIFKIAQDEKYDLILQEAVYRSPRVDITDKVIKALAKD